ncbi:MAG: hypothetical protein HFF89_04625 [Oscillibacter sp.]|nr:hypothetical protein [Oscillibacter sp.]
MDAGVSGGEENKKRQRENPAAAAAFPAFEPAGFCHGNTSKRGSGRDFIKMLQRVKIAFIIKPVREKDKRETMNEMKKIAAFAAIFPLPGPPQAVPKGF